jgi:hypothetical protein
VQAVEAVIGIKFVVLILRVYGVGPEAPVIRPVVAVLDLVKVVGSRGIVPNKVLYPGEAVEAPVNATIFDSQPYFFCAIATDRST